MSGDRLGRLVIRSDLSDLEKLFSFIEQFCVDSKIPDDIKNKLFLIAEELTVNVMSHGYANWPDGVIEIVLEHRGQEIEMRVEDEAPPFDPLAAASEPDINAPLDDRPIGGLGVHLIKTLAKSVDYQFNSGRNVVRATISDRP